MNKRDLKILLISLFLYAINKIVFRVLMANAPFPLSILSNHGNDILAGIVLPAYVNLILFRYGKQIKELKHFLAINLLAGIFWEYITPIYHSNSTSDPLDLLAYLLGGLIYYLIIEKLKASPSE